MLSIATLLYPRGASDLLFLPFSEGSVLFLPGTRRIWTLNHTASVIWCLVGDDPNVDDISSRLSSIYGISLEQARVDTGLVLQVLHEAQLVDTTFIESDTKSNEFDPVPTQSDCALVRAPQGVDRFLISTTGHSIAFCSFDCKVAREYKSALHAFFVSSLDRPVDTTLLLFPSADASSSEHFDIYVNGRCYYYGIHEECLLPILLGVTFTRITESLTDRLLFHSAVLEKNNRAILFPGDAGAGKTTLAATLARKGYSFFADELALLEPNKGLIAPLPLPMSIKTSGVEVLRQLYPVLDQVPVYKRADGKNVKILPPILSTIFNLNLQIEPAVIVFPRYDLSAATQISPLSKAETISRLVSVCSSSRPLVEQDIAAMIRLVDENPCYEAVYSDINTVYEFLEQGAY